MHNSIIGNIRAYNIGVRQNFTPKIEQNIMSIKFRTLLHSYIINLCIWRKILFSKHLTKALVIPITNWEDGMVTKALSLCRVGGRVGGCRSSWGSWPDRFQFNTGRQLSFHSRYHEKSVCRIHTILGHVAIVRRFHMILHFVGPGELLAAYGAGEHLSLLPLVVQEGVPLEWILVFERLLNVILCAFDALVDALVDWSVSKQVETPNGHFG